MKVLSVVGARPQFVKEAALSPMLREHHEEVLVNTGQHYDYELCAEQFEVLDIPKPHYDLGVGSGSHAHQTAAIMVGLEEVLLAEKPSMVVLYGDTNSTLAGALAAAKLGVPIAHVEAGPRQFDMRIPEEINRVVTDRLATLRFAPTEGARLNLLREGITSGVHLTGDVIYDLFLEIGKRLEGMDVASRFELRPGEFLLMTVHRPVNSDSESAMRAILNGVLSSNEKVFFPVHPRTASSLERFGLMEMLRAEKNLLLVKPVHYVDMALLTRSARMVLTDSGGLLREAFFSGIPSVCLDSVASWPEVVDAGWCDVTGCDAASIGAALERFRPSGPRPPLFGDGNACSRILEVLSEFESEAASLLERWHKGGGPA